MTAHLSEFLVGINTMISNQDCDVCQGGGGIRRGWASLPGRVSGLSSPPWGPTSVERQPYDCSLPGLAGFDHEKVAFLPSEGAPPPPARWGRMSQLTAWSSAW